MSYYFDEIWMILWFIFVLNIPTMLKKRFFQRFPNLYALTFIVVIVVTFFGGLLVLSSFIFYQRTVEPYLELFAFLLTIRCVISFPFLSTIKSIREVFLTFVVISFIILDLLAHNPTTYLRTVYTASPVQGRTIHKNEQIVTVSLEFQKLFAYQISRDYEGVNTVKIISVRKDDDSSGGDPLYYFEGEALINDRYRTKFTFAMQEGGISQSDFINRYEEFSSDVPLKRVPDDKIDYYLLEDLKKPKVKKALNKLRITYYKGNDIFRDYLKDGETSAES